MNQPKVSVIIPVYNTGKYLRECLDSVVNQTLKDIEIICVDDGSTDNSPAILREYAAEDGRIKVFTQENINAGAARNTGLSNATGEYLSFLDSDDFLEFNAVERLYECAKSRKAEIVVYRVSTFYENTDRPPFLDLRYNKKLLPEKAVFSFDEIEQNAFLAIKGVVWDKLIKRDIATENHLCFQSLDVFNDNYFAYTALLSAKSITILEEQLIHYRKRASKDSTTDKRYLHIDCAYKALREMKDYLIRNNLFARYERDFISYVIHQLHIDFIAYNRDNLSKGKMRVKIRQWLDEFAVNEHPCSYYYNLREYQALLDEVLCRNKSAQISTQGQLADNRILIPVVYATDQNYMRFVFVSMVSALQNSRCDTFYAFTVLVPSNSGIDSSDINDRLSRFDNYSLSFIEMGDEFKDIPLCIPHLTTPALFRLRIPWLLDKYDKCIYLDGDTIVCDDLQTLYSIDLGDNDLAGVPAFRFYKKEPEHRERLGLTEGQTFQYINSGVLLMNLKKLKEEKKEEQFIQLLGRHYACDDQDILNVACYGKIQLIPYRYNLMTKYARWALKDFPPGVIPYEVISGRMNPAIIHYADKVKPWIDYSCHYSNYWFSVAMTDVCWDLFPDISILKKRKSISDKVRGGVQSCRNHGLGYVIRRMLHRMRSR